VTHSDFHESQQEGVSTRDSGSPDNESGANSTLPGKGLYKPLAEFPKEFNKEFVRSTDWRFLMIVAFSLFFHAGLIYYLFVHLPNTISEEYVTRLQNRFAKMYLSEIDIYDQEHPEISSDILSSASDWVDNLVEETIDPVKQVKTLPRDPDRPDTGAPRERSYEDRVETRSDRRTFRRRSMATLKDDVRSVGLLGIITSGSGLVDNQEVQDILAHADSTTMRIAERIKDVRYLKVPRPGVDYFGQDLDGNGPVFLAERQGRANRVVSTDIEASEFVEALEKPEEKRVERNVRYEDTAVKKPQGIFASLSNRNKVLKKRTRKQIIDVVMAHNPAIQDCYRLELKTDPDLRGEVSVRFVIAPTGSVVHAEITKSSIESKRMLQCILRKIKRWNDFGRVREEQGNLTIRHTYVFDF